MKNLFTILIGFFISFASVASPHPLIDQGIEDLYSSHFLTEEQTLTEEQIKITEQIMETLRTEPFQVVFLDQEEKCFTYHSTSDDVSPCDTQAENLVNNILAKGVSLNNISEENGFSHLQSKGVIPIGQVAGLGEWIFGEWVCDNTYQLLGILWISLGGGLIGASLERLLFAIKAPMTLLVGGVVVIVGIVITGVVIAFDKMFDQSRIICPNLNSDSQG